MFEKIMDRARYLYEMETGRSLETGPAINAIVRAIVEELESRSENKESSIDISQAFSGPTPGRDILVK